MLDNTPKFNQLINDYYNNNHNLKIICRETGEEFELSEGMYDTYKKNGVPLPTVAPHIRLLRMRAHMGGIELFMRTDGQGKDIVSVYDPQSPGQIVDVDYAFSDEFNALQYGKELNVQESFFSQWKKLSETVPRPAIATDDNSENCTWCSYDLEFKNCYATFGGVSNENLLFCDMCINSKHSVDSGNITKSEWCYDSVSCFQCANTYYSAFCESSYDIAFCFGCKNVSNSFGCYNIQNKKYCFFNQQLTKDQYEEYMKKIDLGNRAVSDAYWQKKVKDLWANAYLSANVNFNSERALGDELINCKDTYGISVFTAERLYNTFDASFAKDSCYITTCNTIEKSVNCLRCINAYENKMCIACEGCVDMEYCENCVSCEHCFGCIGLNHKKFCIFNVEYSEEEYWKKLDEIKSAMFIRGEYGEFFPYFTSLFAYNTSHADVFFPLEKEEVEKLQSRWYVFSKNNQTSLTESVPEKLNSVGDDILQKQFICPSSGRLLRVVRPQLTFHKKMNVALPAEHPSVRRKKKYKLMGGLKLHKTNCVECQIEIYTRYNPASSQKIVCGECYNKILLEDRMML